MPQPGAFPRSAKYNPNWLLASISGAANPLWLAEWLTSQMDLRPGMRVLDLGCGRGTSSIFLHHEFGVDVWAADLWFDPKERAQRIRDAGAADHVFAVRADARDLPFDVSFFDAIISIDSLCYYGTDDLYLNYLARFLKSDGHLAYAGAGLMQEIETVPNHLREWWTQDLWCLHSAAWWRRHWERTGIVNVEVADDMPDGWRVWLDWHRIIAPENHGEIQAIEADQGRFIGYIRVVARRNPATSLSEPVISVSSQYTHHPFLRVS